MLGGFVSHWKNPVIAGLFDLAAEFDVPVLVHTEFSRADYTLGLCRAHPGTRFLWAHSGVMLKPAEIKRVLDGCPNVQAELSARDHLDMQAALQPFVDNAISKTITLPEPATIDDVSAILRRAHEAGIKGCTVYREGASVGHVLDRRPDAHCCSLDREPD